MFSTNLSKFLRLNGNLAVANQYQVRNFAKKQPPAMVFNLYNATPELAQVIGSSKTTRANALSKIWDYIKTNNLQKSGEGQGQNFNVDAKLSKLFVGENEPKGAHVMKVLSANLTKTNPPETLSKEQLNELYGDKYDHLF